MKDLISPTMNSLEIAELVGSRHDKVKQSIERLFRKEVIQLPPMGEVENKQSISPNNKISVYCFSGNQGRLDSITVVAQLSPEFTKALVLRWDELENQAAPKQLTTRELLIMNLEALDKIEALEADNLAKAEKIEADAPKVEFVANYVDSAKLFTLTQVAKITGFKRKDLIACLERDGYLYRNSDGLTPYEKPICKKLFSVKTGTSRNGHNYSQTHVTAWGLNRITEKYASELGEEVAA